MHDRRDGVEKCQRVLAGQRANTIGQCGRGEGTGRDNDAVPIRRRLRISSRRISMSGSLSSAAVIAAAKSFAVDGKRAARGQLVGVRSLHHQRTQPAHLGVKETDGAALSVVGAERVRADQLGELSGFMRRGRTNRAHFVQHHGHAAARDLPGGLGTGEAAANDVYWP